MKGEEMARMVSFLAGALFGLVVCALCVAGGDA